MNVNYFFNEFCCSIVNSQPETLERFLIFLKENPNLFDVKEVPEFIFSQTEFDSIKFKFYNDKRLGLSLLTFLSEYPDYIDKQALQEKVFLPGGIHGVLQQVAYFSPIEFNILLKFIGEHASLFEKETIKQLFLRKGSHAYEVSPLHSLAFQQPEGLKLLLKFLSEHHDVIDKQVLQEILVRKTIKGNLLKLTVRCPRVYQIPDREFLTLKSYDLEGLKILLKFLNEHSDRIDKKTIQQLFHQVEDLFELIALKPEALKIVIKFLSEHPDWIDKKDLQRMFLKKQWLDQTAYRLCDQLETTKNFAELIIQHAPLDQKSLKHIFLKKEPDLSLFIIDKVLEKYLKELEFREENHITHTTRFFNLNFGYSTQQKKKAALELEKLFKQPDLINREDLLRLRQAYPALSNGRLGQLFNYCKSTLDTTLAREEIAVPIANASMTR